MSTQRKEQVLTESLPISVGPAFNLPVEQLHVVGPQPAQLACNKFAISCMGHVQVSDLMISARNCLKFSSPRVGRASVAAALPRHDKGFEQDYHSKSFRSIKQFWATGN